MVIDFIFGKSVWVYHVLGFLLIFVQAIIFNSLTISNKVYNDYTYLPAMIYGILMSISFDMYTLSPVLMSVTFILIALNNIFSQVEFRMKKDERILNIGLNLGIAAMFYVPSALFLFITLIALALFSSTIGRRYLLIIYGWSLPVILVIVYFLFTGATSVAWEIFTYKIFSSVKSEYLDNQSIIILISLPLLFLLFAIIRIVQRVHFSNYQVRLAQLMLVWLLLSATLLIWVEKSLSYFILFVPAFAFFISHYFLLLRKTIKAELLFSLFWIGIIFLNISTYFQWFGLNEYVKLENLMVKETAYNQITNGKKIIVLGNEFNIYNESSGSTPFLDWHLSKKVLTNPDYYDNATAIHNGFANDPPEIIIDLENVMPDLQRRILFLEENYVKKQDKIYVRNE